MDKNEARADLCGQLMTSALQQRQLRAFKIFHSSRCSYITDSLTLVQTKRPDHHQGGRAVQTKCNLGTVTKSHRGTQGRNWNVTWMLVPAWNLFKLAASTASQGCRVLPEARREEEREEGGGRRKRRKRKGGWGGREISGQALSNLVVGMSCLWVTAEDAVVGNVMRSDSCRLKPSDS